MRLEHLRPTTHLIEASSWPTIDFGRVVRGYVRERSTEGIDEAIGEDQLRGDVATAERGVLRLIRVPLDDGQFHALVSFTFNLGAGSLQRSTLRRKANREEHERAPAEFMRWVRAGGRKLKGLVRRRRAEAERYVD